MTNYQSEAELEKNLIQQLMEQGYESVSIPDYDSLLANFRRQVNRFNVRKLEGNLLSDSEFDRLLTMISGKSVFDSAKILRDKQVLQRDDGTRVYLELFNTKDWCKNLFQVTHQTTVIGKRTNRYDVTILINGLPMVQIELKRRGLDFAEAFHQIQRYRKDSFRGLLRYLQIFVVSNGMDTKYFANSDGEILFGQTFFWSDAENKRITVLRDFAASFLEKCHIAKMIARYMVINETEKHLMVMRPYQVYAVEALVKRALETGLNGYIWHTTGSGKTLTSFKASQILAHQPGIDKVFFLVDRKDLDSQTLSEFNKFEPGSVDMTDETDTLVKQIKDLTKPLILTTIQKMANAVKKEQYARIMDQYRDKKVVFIIDECHRSQFGEMHRLIARHFEKAMYFGFTGTPRFEENQSQDGRVTADLFEKCLHTYLIKDAIRDGNVLGFSVEYISTVQGRPDIDEDSLVSGIDTDEVMLHPDRLTMVASHILSHHEAKAKQRGYNALFAVQSIPMLIKYYDIFKKLDHNLNIAGIFTFGVNEDSEGRDEQSRDALERMIEDYNGLFETNYSTDKFGAYFSDVSKKVKTGRIDILLVVNMFLTGYDSRILNTLYIDKNLKHHDLIQAFSRTNRVEKKTKPYGNIVCYRNLKKRTDEAILLFSRTNSVDDVLMRSFEEYLRLFQESLEALKGMAETPEAVDLLETEEEKHRFVICFRELTRMLTRLQTFTEFEFNPELLGITEQQYQDYKSKYLAIHKETGEKERESILSDVDFEIELMHTDRINVSYIMNLIKSIDFNNRKQRDETIRKIHEELNRADNEELRLKAELFRKFLNTVVPDLTNDDSVDEAYSVYEEEQRTEEIIEFAKEVGQDPEYLAEYIREYEYSGMISKEDISNTLDLPFLKRRKMTARITQFIRENAAKYA